MICLTSFYPEMYAIKQKKNENKQINVDQVYSMFNRSALLLKRHCGGGGGDGRQLI